MKRGHESPRYKVAAPSYVKGGTVRENCFFLRSLFSEIALCLFETRACLDYTEADLGTDLARLGLSYHVHLPLDLPWESGAENVLDIIIALAEKTAFLSPHAYVLHPPEKPADLAALVNLLPKSALSPDGILIENVRDRNLCDFWEVISASGLGICLDLGHLLAYSQQGILDLRGFFERVRILHLYGAEIDGRHKPLTHLDAQGTGILREVLARADDLRVIVLELFNQTDLLESRAIFADWMLTLGYSPEEIA